MTTGRASVRHLHQFGRIEGLGTGLRYNQCNQLSDVTHLVTRQQRHRRELKPLAGLGVGFNRRRQVVKCVRCHVGRDQDRQNAGRLAGLRHVDRANSRMGVRRADKHRVRHEGKRQIVQIGAAANQKARILTPPRGSAEPETRRRPLELSGARASGTACRANRRPRDPRTFPAPRRQAPRTRRNSPATARHPAPAPSPN